MSGPDLTRPRHEGAVGGELFRPHRAARVDAPGGDADLRAEAELRAVYGRNPRYWLFTYPALKLPLPAASLYTLATAAASKLFYMAQVPNFWRKQT